MSHPSEAQIQIRQISIKELKSSKIRFAEFMTVYFDYSVMVRNND